MALVYFSGEMIGEFPKFSSSCVYKQDYKREVADRPPQWMSHNVLLSVIARLWAVSCWPDYLFL